MCACIYGHVHMHGRTPDRASADGSPNILPDPRFSRPLVLAPAGTRRGIISSERGGHRRAAEVAVAEVEDLGRILLGTGGPEVNVQ